MKQRQILQSNLRFGQKTSRKMHGLFQIFLISFAFASISGANVEVGEPRLVGEVKLPNAAFIEAYVDQGDETSLIGDRYTLYISTFNANPLSGPDPKYMLRGLGSNLNQIGNWSLQLIDRTAPWPNNPDQVPTEVFNTTAIVWTTGFLVPPKTKGRLEIYDTSKTPPVGPFNIAAGDTSDWSYHRVIWKDMDGDGDLDALTARFYKPIIGITRKNLLWLENPGLPLHEQPASGWTQHLMKEVATDVHFRMANLTLNGTQNDCLISAEFFNEKLMLYCTPIATGNWSDWSTVQEILIDDTIGQIFDVYYDDFNVDGKKEILITAYNHSRGNVFVYEVADNIVDLSTAFTKRTIADGFIANTIIGGQSMTPGAPKPFFPTRAYEQEILPDGRGRKPYIMLSGDDDGRHYILEPLSDERNDWSYNKRILVDTEKTTSGKFAVGDFDGDGYADIVCAGYSSGTIYAFTYAP